MEKVLKVNLKNNNAIELPAEIIKSYPLGRDEKFVFVSIEQNCPDAVCVRRVYP